VSVKESWRGINKKLSINKCSSSLYYNYNLRFNISNEPHTTACGFITWYTLALDTHTSCRYWSGSSYTNKVFLISGHWFKTVYETQIFVVVLSSVLL
jgi:hypothetical protein